MAIRKIVALAALVASGGAMAQSPQPESFSYKGAQLGASIEQFQSALPDFKCRAGTAFCFYDRQDCGGVYRRQSSEQLIANLDSCNARTSFGGALVDSATAYFVEGKLARLSLTIPTAHMEKLGLVLSEVYGKPATEDLSPVKNRAGASFSNWVRTWNRSDDVLLAAARAGKIDDGSVMITSGALIRKNAEESEKAVQSGKKDF